MKKTIKVGEGMRVGIITRFFRNLCCFPAWFMPHKRLRVFFHRLKGVKISKDVEIGYMVFTDNRRPESIKIEEGATVCSNSVILAHDLSKRRIDGTETIGNVLIKKDAFIGMNCIILPGVSIGQKSVVAAGSVVTSDVGDDETVAGVPARSMK